MSFFAQYADDAHRCALMRIGRYIRMASPKEVEDSGINSGMCVKPGSWNIFLGNVYNVYKHNWGAEKSTEFEEKNTIV